MSTDTPSGATAAPPADEATPPQRGTGEPNTDIAALGGGVVAIAMTIFGDEGPYDWFGLAIAGTLLLLIVAYVLPHERKGLKRWAVAAVLGLVCAPITGYVMERQAGPWTHCDTWNDQRVAAMTPRPAGGFQADDACGDIASIGEAVSRLYRRGQAEPRSTVREGATLLAWLATAFAFLAWDLARTGRRKGIPPRKPEGTGTQEQVPEPPDGPAADARAPASASVPAASRGGPAQP